MKKPPRNRPLLNDTVTAIAAQACLPDWIGLFSSLLDYIAIPSCLLAKRARRRPCTVRRGMRSTRLGTLRTSFWIVGARSALLSPSSIWGHCFIATYQIIMTWMLESRKPPRPLVRYVIISSVLAMCLSGSKGRFKLVMFWRCCCMGANRGASRLSPSLACATGITNAYVKCAG